MSIKLAISAALSVLMMSGYVLFGPHATRAPLGPQAGAASLPSVRSAPPPSPPALLPFAR